MDRAYLVRVILFYVILGLLIAANHLFGEAISEQFQFFGNVALVLIAAVSILMLLVIQLKRARKVDKSTSASAKEELFREIVKKIAK